MAKKVHLFRDLFLNRFLGRDNGPGIQVNPNPKNRSVLSRFKIRIVDDFVRDANGVKLINTDYDDAWGVPSSSTLFEKPAACREEALQRLADAAEKSKIELSTLTQSSIRLDIYKEKKTK